MRDVNNFKSCCSNNIEKNKKGICSGMLYGLAPHTFCIAFIIFTIMGASAATTLLRPLLLSPYFFYTLIILSLAFATLSAMFYLKKNQALSLLGIKRKWKYLIIFYSTTVVVNLLLFMVIFPAATNIGSNSAESLSNYSLIALSVEIPCPGHAPLIAGELKKVEGVENIRFKFPNLFDVSYNSAVTSPEEMLSLEVFSVYGAVIIGEESKEAKD